MQNPVDFFHPATVVITGANRGIGFSFTKLLLSQGATVFALCREESSQLVSLGETFSTLTIVTGIEVASADCIPFIQDAVKNQSIDLLINNAGILGNESLDALDFESIERQLQVNTLGPLRVTSALLPYLSDSAKIAMITSRMGSISDNSSGGRYGYRLSKAALNAASVSLAKDLKARGIAVAILHPGLVGTDMIGGVGDITPDQAAERLQQRIAELTLENTGTFWHSNGEILPW